MEKVYFVIFILILLIFIFLLVLYSPNIIVLLYVLKISFIGKSHDIKQGRIYYC